MRTLSPHKIEKLSNGNVVFYEDSKARYTLPGDASCTLDANKTQLIRVFYDVDDINIDILSLTTLTLNGVDTTLTPPSKGDDAAIRTARDTIYETLVNDYFFKGGDTIAIAGLGDAAYTTTITSWTLDSGDLYYADVRHNLGVQFVVTQVYDSSTLNEVGVEDTQAINSTTVRIWVRGNTHSLRIVVLHGLYVLGLAGSGLPVVYMTETGNASINTFIDADATTATFNIVLPTAVEGQGKIVIQKSTAANTVSVRSSGADLINGSASANLTSQYESITLYPKSTGWAIT